jgi:photosystem II stability/assembly factor-like uncharacterized protein
MRRILVLSLLAGTALAALLTAPGCGGQQTADSGSTSGVAAQLRAWAVGERGTILATTDGGTSWIAQRSGTNETLTDVAVADSAHGWAVGAEGTVLITGDGGATWTAQRPGALASRLDAVACSGPTHAWAVGSSSEDRPVILATVDGGATWSLQYSGVEGDRFTDVTFASASNGWAVHDQGAVLATTDGGATWVARFDGASRQPPERLEGVAFCDSMHGWAVGGRELKGGLILATTDGGMTWATQRSGLRGDYLFTSVVCNDSGCGWVASFGDVILTTRDGGGTWKARSSGSRDNVVYALAFRDSLHGWAVGSRRGEPGDWNSVILATTDGGVTWTKQRQVTDSYLSAVACVPSSSAGAGGSE